MSVEYYVCAFMSMIAFFHILLRIFLNCHQILQFLTKIKKIEKMCFCRILAISCIFCVSSFFYMATILSCTELKFFNHLKVISVELLQ